MLRIVPTNKFKRDLKTAVKRGCPIGLLDEIVNLLAERRPLPEKNRDHALTANYIGCRECHITPDWLLIYQTDEDALRLYLLRTGTHSDVF